MFFKFSLSNIIAHNKKWEKTLQTLLLRRVFKDRLKDVNALRVEVGGISDHYLVEAKLKIKTRHWGGKGEGEGMRVGDQCMGTRGARQ